MTSDDLATLWEEADALPDSPAKLALQEEVVRRADASGDVDAAFAYRVELMGTALDVGRGDVLAVAFGWCVAKHDEDPARFGTFDLLWRYRWVISELTEYPYISQAHLDGLVADMRRRYLAAGVSLRGFHMLRLNVATQLWGAEAAAEAHQAWKRSPRDEYADDPEAERYFELAYADELRKRKVVIERGRKLLADPSLGEFYGVRVRGMLLLPLTLAGHLEEAADCHRGAVRYLRKSARFSGREDHIKFLTVTGNLTAAVKLAEGYLTTAVSWVSPWCRFQFYVALAFLFQRIATAGRRVRKLRWPPEPGPWPATTDPAELAAWFDAEARALAAAFDARSPTGYAQKRLDETAELAAESRPFPLG